MASSTRLKSKSRISEGLSTRSSARNNIATTSSIGNNLHLHNNNTGNNHANNHHNLPLQHKQEQHLQLQQSNVGRRKRKIEDLDLERGDRDREVDLRHNRKIKIAVEISPLKVNAFDLGLETGRAGGLGRTRSVVVKSTTISTKTHHISRARSQSQRLATPIPTPPPPAESEVVEKVQSPLKVSPKKTVGHHEKVVNGIRHELDRLQPNAADLKKDEKRKLRSQEDQWFKSELSAYLPEYDVVIGNIPKEESKLLFVLVCLWKLIMYKIFSNSTHPLLFKIPLSLL